MPERFKSAAEAIAGNPLSFRLIVSSLCPGTLVLAFHNVLSERTKPRGDRSLHLPVSVFCDIIDWLADTFRVVTLDQAFRKDEAREGKPRAAITFDDAYTGAVAVGIPEVWRRGLPATVFAISGAEAGRTFWWDALSDGWSDGMPDAVRNAALFEARGVEAEVRAWARREGLPVATLADEFVAASWDDIRRASRLPGITIASHTRTHANLSALDAGEVAEELAGSRDELQKLVEGSRPWLTYPYGLSSPAVEQEAEAAGYEMAFRVTGGVLRSSDLLPSQYALPRLNIPAGLSLRGFRLRAAGLLGR